MDERSSDRERARELEKIAPQPGVFWLYDPPLEFAPAPDELAAGARRAFRAILPRPPNGDASDEAFFYRLETGRVVGYFNRCTHVQVPMDFDDGEFLDAAGFILCRLHGARYDPATGEACSGPARTHLTRVLCEDASSPNPDEAPRLRVFGWERVRRPRAID